MPLLPDPIAGNIPGAINTGGQADLIPVLPIGVFQGRAKLGKKEALFIRIAIPSGTYDRIECAVVTGGKSSRKIDMGVYLDDGLSPTPSPTGTPLVSTGLQSTANLNHKFMTQTLPSDLVVEVSGFYWLAIVSDQKNIQIVMTPNKFDPVWRDRLYCLEDNHGTSLGSIGTLTTGGGSGSSDAGGGSAIPYLAIRRKA